MHMLLESILRRAEYVLWLIVKSFLNSHRLSFGGTMMTYCVEFLE